MRIFSLWSIGQDTSADMNPGRILSSRHLNSEVNLRPAGVFGRTRPAAAGRVRHWFGPCPGALGEGADLVPSPPPPNLRTGGHSEVGELQSKTINECFF